MEPVGERKEVILGKSYLSLSNHIIDAFSRDEMEAMITMFGADFAKNVQNKRKRLDTFTQASLQTSNKKVKEICATQQLER